MVRKESRFILKIWVNILMKRINKKRGPKPENLTIKGDWQEAVKKAIKRGKPPEGWPKDKK